MSLNNFTEYFVQLFDKRTGQPSTDSSGVANVLTAGSPVEVTLYNDDIGTAASNPVTINNGAIKFYTAKTVTSVDLSILTSDGYAVFIEGLTPSQHRVEIDKENRRQVLIIPFAASDNTETDTGFDMPANCRIDPFGLGLKVVTADDTETIDVGLLSSETGGDADGLIAAASVATAGWVGLYDGFGVATATLGELVSNTVTQTSNMFEATPYVTDGVAKSITYTGSAGSDTAAGYIVITYDKLI